METFSALLAICAGNSPVTGGFPAQGPVTRSFDVFFDPCLNKRLSKQSWGWWFETPSHPLWRHCSDIISNTIILFVARNWQRPRKDICNISVRSSLHRQNDFERLKMRGMYSSILGFTKTGNHNFKQSLFATANLPLSSHLDYCLEQPLTLHRQPVIWWNFIFIQANVVYDLFSLCGDLVFCFRYVLTVQPK